MKLLMILTLMTLSVSVYATSKADINMALDAMAKSGNFSKEQVEQARKELNSMSQEELDEIEKKAIKLKDDPRIREQAEKLNLSR